MKDQRTWRNLIAFAAGCLFAIGLAVSGMTQPQKVIGFLNPWEWDSALIFVMLGAVGVHVLSYLLVKRKSSPLLDMNWHLPHRKDVTPRLILGSAIFGVGWGIGGFCPGPGVASLATGESRVLLFVGMMIVGMLLFKVTERHLGMRE